MFKQYPITCPNLPKDYFDYYNNLMTGMFKKLKEEQIISKVRPVFESIHDNNNLRIYYFDGNQLDGTLFKIDLNSKEITLMGEPKKIDKFHGMLESILKINLEAQFIDYT
jgi:hypothetical protein